MTAAAALAYAYPSDMTAGSPSPSAQVTVASDVLGTLTVDRSAIVTFPRGLLGFPECRDFVLMPAEREHLYWLQSVQYSTLAFLSIDPFVFFPGYTVDLGSTDLAKIATSPNDVMVLSIVTLPNSRDGQPTANLQGPVVVNTQTQQAFQTVLSDGQYGIREAFTL